MRNKLLLILLFILVILSINACNPKLTNKSDYESINEEKIKIKKENLLNKMPIIQSYSFGSIVIAGKSYGDIKIYKENIMPWNYIKHHVFTTEDIADIVEDIDFLVIGIGYNSKVKVEDDVLISLSEKKIIAIIKPTTQAVEEYNKLVMENKKVAAILHSTC